MSEGLRESLTLTLTPSLLVLSSAAVTWIALRIFIPWCLRLIRESRERDG